MSMCGPLNKRFAWRLTTGSAFFKMARVKAIIEIILLVGLGECARDLTKCVPWVPKDIFSYRYWYTHSFRLMYFENGPLELGYKMCSLRKTLTRSPQKRSKPALTYHELLSNFNFPLDLDNSARRCSACSIALTSSKYKQSAERFVNVSKHFQFSLFWNGKGSHIFKKISSQISVTGFEARKSRCSVQQWINICFPIFPALLSYGK